MFAETQTRKRDKEDSGKRESDLKKRNNRLFEKNTVLGECRKKRKTKNENCQERQKWCRHTNNAVEVDLSWDESQRFAPATSDGWVLPLLDLGAVGMNAVCRLGSNEPKVFGVVGGVFLALFAAVWCALAVVGCVDDLSCAWCPCRSAGWCCEKSQRCEIWIFCSFVQGWRVLGLLLYGSRF